ncbi:MULTISPECIES: cation acetate symporter [unclassified Streptomyces]|uniref:sodium/solute symporter n=1 Tax=unclassified Streptomyces TaxID=2593676 RepID=UPI0035E2F07F
MTHGTGGSLAAQTLDGTPFMAFLVIVCLSVLLYLLYGADAEGTADVYVARRSQGPVANAFALAGDHISVVTLLSVTGLVALDAYDGMALAVCAIVALGVLLVLAQPLHHLRRYTLGDTLGARFPGGAARIAGTVATLSFCLPLTVVQLVVAGAAVTQLLGLSDVGPAAQVCTAFIGAIMICAAALSGMRGNSVLQAIKTVILLLAMTVLAGQVLDEFGWSPNRLLDAAARNSVGPADYYEGGVLTGDGPTAALSRLSTQITVVLGAGVAPHLLMRVNAADRGSSARRTVGYAIGLVTAFSGLAVLLGLGASGLVGAKTLLAPDPEGQAALPLLALRLAHEGSGGGIIMALTVSMVFLTGLTVVAALTLTSAASLAHDVFARTTRGSRGGTTEIGAMRWSATVVGALAVTLAIILQGKNFDFLGQFAVTVAAATVLPALVLELFWSGYTRAGMLWTVYGGLGCCVLLQLFGPAVSGAPHSVLSDVDFAWFPLASTGLVSVPVGFLLGWAASRMTASGSAVRSAHTEWEEMALTGTDASDRPR